MNNWIKSVTRTINELTYYVFLSPDDCMQEIVMEGGGAKVERMETFTMLFKKVREGEVR